MVRRNFWRWCIYLWHRLWWWFHWGIPTSKLIKLYILNMYSFLYINYTWISCFKKIMANEQWLQVSQPEVMCFAQYSLKGLSCLLTTFSNSMLFQYEGWTHAQSMLPLWLTILRRAPILPAFLCYERSARNRKSLRTSVIGNKLCPSKFIHWSPNPWYLWRRPDVATVSLQM